MSQGGPESQGERLARAASSKSRAVIIEDHPAYAEIIRIALERSGWFEVAGIAATPKEGVALIAAEKPDAVLIDVGLPSGSQGVTVAAEAKRLLPATTIVMLTGSEDPQHVRDSMPVRVDGFLSKTIRTEHIAPAVLCACSGLQVMSKSAMEAALEERTTSPCPLAEDQLLLLKLAAQDLTVSEIAAHTLASRSKVYRAFSAIQHQLGAEGLTGAIVIAARKGWI